MQIVVLYIIDKRYFLFNIFIVIKHKILISIIKLMSFRSSASVSNITKHARNTTLLTK